MDARLKRGDGTLVQRDGTHELGWAGVYKRSCDNLPTGKLLHRERAPVPVVRGVVAGGFLDGGVQTCETSVGD